MGTRILCDDGSRKICSDGSRSKVCCILYKDNYTVASPSGSVPPAGLASSYAIVDYDPSMFPFSPSPSATGPVWDGVFTYNSGKWFTNGNPAGFVKIGDTYVRGTLEVVSDDPASCWPNSQVRINPPDIGPGGFLPVERVSWLIVFQAEPVGFGGPSATYKKGGPMLPVGTHTSPTQDPYCLCFNENTTASGVPTKIKRFWIA